MKALWFRNPEFAKSYLPTLTLLILERDSVCAFWVYKYTFLWLRIIPSRNSKWLASMRNCQVLDLYRTINHHFRHFLVSFSSYQNCQIFHLTKLNFRRHITCTVTIFGKTHLSPNHVPSVPVGHNVHDPTVCLVNQM